MKYDLFLLFIFSIILKQEKHFLNITGRTRGYERPERPPLLAQVPSDGQVWEIM